MLVIVETGLRVVAGWEVDIHTHWGGISVAILVGKSYAGAGIAWILDTDTMKTIGVSWPAWGFAGTGWASYLHRLNGALSRVEDASATRARRRTQKGISCGHTEATWEGLNIVVGGFKEVIDVHVEHFDARERAVGGLEVKIRDPIIAQVILDQRIGARRSRCDVVVHG